MYLEIATSAIRELIISGSLVSVKNIDLYKQIFQHENELLHKYETNSNK